MILGSGLRRLIVVTAVEGAVMDDCVGQNSKQSESLFLS